jgi:hypothetical protein
MQAGQRAEAFEQARGASEKATSDLKETQRRFQAGEVGEPEVQAAQQRVEEAQRSFDEAAEAMVEAEPTSAQEPRPGEQKTSSEGGFLDVGAAAEAGERFAEMARMLPVKALGHALSPVFNNPIAKWVSTGLQERLREKLGKTHPELVESAFTAEANARRNESRWAPLQRELAKTAGRRIPELEVEHWLEGATDSGWEVGFREDHAQSESDLQELLNIDRRGLSDEAKAALEAHDAATQAVRERAHDLGVKVTNDAGEQVPIARETSKKVMPRQWTSTAREALMRGEGPLYHGIVDGIAFVNKMSPETVVKILGDEGFTEARSLKRKDPIELMRRFNYVPDRIRNKETGKVEKLLETNLLHHGEAMLDLAAKRLGVIEELGQDLPVERKEGEPNQEDFADGLPVPYLSLVNSVPKPQRPLVAAALRALQGMAVTKPSDLGEHSDAWNKTIEVAQEINSVAAAAKMTLGSPVQNIVEPWAMATALLGRGRTGAAASYVHSMMRAGRFTELLQEREEAGGFALHTPDFMVGGEQSLFEQFKTATKAMRQALLTGFEFTQAVTDAKIHKAWHDAVDGWRTGEYEPNDAQALKTLFGFDTARAEQIVKGEAPARVYDNIAVNGLVRITRRGDMPINKTGLGLSKAGRWIHFLSFFGRQTESTRNAANAMRDAKTSAESDAAAKNFARIMGFNLGTYVASQALMKFLQGGWDELQGYFSETMEDVSTPGGAAKFVGAGLVGSLFGSVGSFVSGGLYALATGDERDIAHAAETIGRLVPGVGSTIEAAKFVHAVGTTLGGGTLGAGSDYAGKTPLQQLGHWLGNEVPLAKWVENGPLGVGMTYLGTDPELENALKASRRFDSKHDVGDDSRGNADALFVDTMRAAVNKLKASDGGSHTDEIADAIRAAMPDKDDSAIATSFENRRQFAGENWTQLSEEQQAAKVRSLGQKRVELLRGYDAVLEQAASYFRPNPLLRRRLRRR